MQYLKKVHFHAATAESKAFGFKALYAQLGAHRGLLEALFRESARIVHLTRRDKLAAYLSKVYMEKMDIVHTDTPINKTPIYIDTGAMCQYISKSSAMEEKYRKKIQESGIPLTEVCYEDMKEKPFETFQILQSFLGVSAEPLSSSMVKVNSAPLHESIINFDEVLRKLEDLDCYCEATS